jgi:hypothetical protein
MPDSNNTPSVEKGTNKSSTRVVGPTQPTLIDHNVNVVSGGGGADDILESVNDNALSEETAHNLKHTSTGNKANTDNNAKTFDKHPPGNLLYVNIGVSSNET